VTTIASMTRTKSNTIALALVAAAAPVLSGVAAVYHERNVAADRQARRDEAILSALMDCVQSKQERGEARPKVAPTPPPYPLPAPTTIPVPPDGAVLKMQLPKGKQSRAASRILDSIARNHGWEEK
jgi:hypothetical protein